MRDGGKEGARREGRKEGKEGGRGGGKEEVRKGVREENVLALASYVSCSEQTSGLVVKRRESCMAFPSALTAVEVVVEVFSVSR